MIRLKSIQIEEFRGIRSLDLDLDAKNFGICGPNGTGKSGVVDAIEFCLTGDVTRLSGQGSAGLSVRAHAPHVDQKDHPENASVTITADVPSLGTSVTIHRSVKNPRQVNVTPADAAAIAVIEELQTHPEFALSRREIVKYIITPPGRRSEDVQTLLRLEHLEKLRKSLTSFRNKRKTEAAEARRVLLQAETDLASALKMDELEPARVLEKINEKRGILDLGPLAELTEDASFKDGVAAPNDTEGKPPLGKAVALADISALQTAVNDEEPDSLVENRQAAHSALEELRVDEHALTLARQYGLIETGLGLIAEEACPLCDTPWEMEALREHLRGKLLDAEKIAQVLQQLGANINVVLDSLVTRKHAVEKAIDYSQSLELLAPQTQLTAYRKQLKDAEKALNEFLSDHNRIAPAAQSVAESWWLPTPDQRNCIEELRAAASALPDTSAEDEAREVLSIAQDRYERLLRETKTVGERESRDTVAKQVLDHYNDSCSAILEGIYDQVVKDFSKFYCVINREDEKDFVGKLTSAPAKLSFDVDFYGRGLAPPGAYHSEGHQDAMGLCLYLALMKHTLNDRFTFAVLDDVLMSVDTSHRREVCRLLKSEFPKTQFILTTHDRVWLQYMKTEGLIGHSQLFGGWTVDTGPRVWNDHDIWTEIESDLHDDDVARAAGLLRRYLEYTAAILADNLRAPVKYRGDGHYGLGDLLPPALKEWRKRLVEGEKSAAHWKRNSEKEAIAGMRAEAKKLVAKTHAEEWAINPTVHFNEWANLQPEEFQDVVCAFRELLESLRCENQSCGSYLFVLPFMGTAEEIRCNCGATTINLRTGS